MPDPPFTLFIPGIPSTSHRFASFEILRDADATANTVIPTASDHRRKRVEEELRECTFHPRVEGQAGPRAPVDPDELARRLAQKSIRSGQGSGQMTTEELELREHCTFRPNMSKAV